MHLSGRRSARATRRRRAATSSRPPRPVRHRRGPTAAASASLGDERHRRVRRAPRAHARCRRRPGARPRRRCPAEPRSGGPAAGTPARAPRPACCGCSSSRCARRSCRRPTAGRPARRRRSRSTPTARARSRRAARCSWCPGRRRRPGRARPGRGRRGTRRRPAGSPRRCRRRPPTGGTAPPPRCPAGATTCTGRRAPPLAGMVGSVAAAERERHRAHGHRLDRVDVARLLRVGAGEVEGDVRRRRCAPRRRSRIGCCCSGRGPGRVEHVVDAAQRPSGKSRERGAHPSFAVVEDLGERLVRRRHADRATSSAIGDAEPVGADAGRRGHRAARRACATPTSDAARTSVVEPDGRECAAPPRRSSSRVGRHRAGRGAAHVGVVGAVGDPAHERAVDEHRRDQRHVVEMGAARERVVDHHLLARSARSPDASIAAATDAGIEPRCTGMCSAWASSSPAAVNTRRRAVGPLLDVGAERGAPQHRAHLVGAPTRAGTRGSGAPASGSRPLHDPARPPDAGVGAPSPRAPTACSRARRRPRVRPPRRARRAPGGRSTVSGAGRADAGSERDHLDLGTSSRA